MSITTTQNLRKINREKVIKALQEHGESNKNQLAEYTSLSVGTCYNILQELLNSKEVVMGKGFASTGGRKAKSYKLNENFSQKLTISFHREYHEVYYVLRVYNHVDQQIYENFSQQKFKSFENLCLHIEEIIQMFENICVIAISIPAIVSQDGNLENISLVNGLEKFSCIDIKKELELRFQKKVIVENDVNVAAIGYYCHHQNIHHVGFIYQPKDDLAGFAFIVNGQLMRGAHGLVGETPFLPLMTQQQQYKYLKTSAGIVEILSIFIVMMMIMNDPQEIVIACENIKDEDILYEKIKKVIPDDHFIPKITLINDIESYIFDGLILMSRESQVTNLVMTTQKIY